MSFTQKTREAVSSRVVAGATILTLGFTAAACSNPFETGEIAGIEAPTDDGDAIDRSQQPQVEIDGVDADGDGEADDTVIINGGAGQATNAPDLLEDANQTGGSMSGEELSAENPSIILDIFGTEGITTNGESVQQRAYEHVIGQLAAGTYEYDVTLGHWEGIFIEHNPDDIRNIVTVHYLPVFFEVGEHGNSFLASSEEMSASGETKYMPVAARVGTFEEEQPGSISVITYDTHYYVGGNGKTVTSNQVTIDNPGTPDSPTPVDELRFRAGDDRIFTPTQVTYDASQLDRILAAAEASGMPIFTHERNRPAGVITSQ